MIYENPPIYVDPKYWEKRAYAAESLVGKAEARMADDNRVIERLGAEVRTLKARLAELEAQLKEADGLLEEAQSTIKLLTEALEIKP